MSDVFKNIVVTIKAVDEASSVIEKQQVALSGFANIISGLGPGFEQIGSVIQGFAVGGPMGAAVAGVGDIVTGLKGCVDEAQKMETVWTGLKTVIENSGTTWDAAGAKIKIFLDSMMSVSKFSEADLGNALKVLVGYGMDVDTAMKTMTATMDLATAKQVSLETAATAVGKAFEGQDGILTRMGITISDATPKAEKFATQMGEIEKRFGSAAQADVETYAGKWTQLTNKLNELAEKIGNAILPALTDFADFVVKATDRLLWFCDQVSKGVEELNKLWKSIADGAKTAMDSINNTLNAAGKGITDTFTGIYNSLVGHSIWPDMWKAMIDTAHNQMQIMIENNKTDLRTFGQAFGEAKGSFQEGWQDAIASAGKGANAVFDEMWTLMVSHMKTGWKTLLDETKKGGVDISTEFNAIGHRWKASLVQGWIRLWRDSGKEHKQ